MSASSGNGTKMDRGRPQNRSDASFSWEADAKSWRLLLLIPGSYLQRLSMRLLGVFSPNISKHTHMTVLGALRSSFIIRHDRGTSAWKHKQCKRNEAGAQEGHYSDGLVARHKAVQHISIASIRSCRHSFAECTRALHRRKVRGKPWRGRAEVLWFSTPADRKVDCRCLAIMLAAHVLTCDI